MADKLQEAIARIKSGDKQGGKKLIGEVLRENPNSETAWLWMSGVVETDQQRKDCLERILKINPQNQQAIRGLEKLHTKSQPSSQPEPPAPAQPPPIAPLFPTYSEAVESSESAFSFLAEEDDQEESAFSFLSETLGSIEPASTPVEEMPTLAPEIFSFLTEEQETSHLQGALPSLRSGDEAVEEFDFFSTQGVEQEKPANYTAPFDDASLQDFFRNGVGDFESFDDPSLGTSSEATFGPFGPGGDDDATFSFDEMNSRGDIFLAQILPEGDEDHPEPLPDVMSETPGFFEQGVQQPDPYSAPFSGGAQGAFLDQEQGLEFGEGAFGATSLDALADYQTSASPEPRTTGSDLQAPDTRLEAAPSDEQRVWGDPKSNTSRLTVVSEDGIVITNPSRSVLRRVQEQIERGDVPDDEVMSQAIIVRLEDILSAQAATNDTVLKIERRAEQGTPFVDLVYSSAKIRDEIFNELHAKSRGRLMRSTKRASFLATSWVPLALMALILVLTITCWFVVLSVIENGLGTPVSATQVQLMQLLVQFGPCAVPVLGGLLLLGAVGWLLITILRPPRTTILRQRG
ncbi:MAG: hypothetical protein JW726_14920 [Anaerolineales bacterium]|nr:hypothetical protein [Anaerolineales bacterium]